jgi:hypothetical protein
VRHVAGSVRHSLREIGSIFCAVCFTKIVLTLLGVHYILPVEVLMETALHFLATLILHVAAVPLSAAGPRLAPGALLRSGG